MSFLDFLMTVKLLLASLLNYGNILIIFLFKILESFILLPVDQFFINYWNSTYFYLKDFVMFLAIQGLSYFLQFTWKGINLERADPAKKIKFALIVL